MKAIDKQRLSRRQFLKLVSAFGALAALPTAYGYSLVRAGAGEFPPSITPYTMTGSENSQQILTPSNPLLIVTNERASNQFGPYLAEILRAEGVNCFQVADLTIVSNSILEEFSLVILAEGPLDNNQADLLEGYVANGGNLVAMRPVVRLATLFGLQPMSGSTSQGYIKVGSEDSIGKGVIPRPLQFHGVADHYRLAGAQAIAWLVTGSDSSSEFPAVTIHDYGQGQAAAWAFDLARSVVYSRQGNPAWADQERDGRNGVRAHDAFVDWIDLELIDIPQADEQMRLLSQLVTLMLVDKMPLPRLWYFPGTAKSMLIATGDSHTDPAWAIEDVLTRIEQRGGNMSIYYTAHPRTGLRPTLKRAMIRGSNLPLVESILARRYTAPMPSHVTDWRARGHEFGLHPYVEEGLETGWRDYWKEFTGRGYGPVSPTVRTHRILWTGWVETARVQAMYGIRMNLDYYHVGPAFQNEAGEWPIGHFTGSGLPMKFVDNHGRILKIYQQLTHLVDEHILAVPWGTNGWMKLNAEPAVEISQMLLRRSVDGAYGAIGVQFHVDSFTDDFAEEAARWLEGTVDYAAELDIPVWSAEMWLNFTEIRHDAALTDIQWNQTTQHLTFRLESQATANLLLTMMIPFWYDRDDHRIRLDQVMADGMQVSFDEQTLAGVKYGVISLETGSHQIMATYV